MPNWREVPIAAQANQAPRAQSNGGEPEAEGGPRFVARTPVRTMAQLVVSDDVRSRVHLALRQLEYHKVLYEEWNLKRIDPGRTGTALNFHGPSGTGKSLAAEAIAHQLGRGFIDVNYAEIESKYVGDTSKNIVSAFAQAAAQRAVLVFNEADSILGSRLSQVTQSADHSVNSSRAVMLSQLDAFHGLVVFTTNFPGNYDSAFVRRILVHVRFDLPDQGTREKLWRHLIPDELPKAGPLDFGELARRSEGLAGGDMVNIILAAAAEVVGRDESERRLRTGDLLAEIEATRQAKAEVGKPVHGVRVVSVDHVDRVPDDLT